MFFLKQIIGTNIRNKKYPNPANNFPKGKCSPCYVTQNMCYKQLDTTATFTSNQTSDIVDTDHTFNCKSKYAI